MSFGIEGALFRNISKRIEVVTPIFAAGPRQRLWEILDICLRDQREAWVLDAEGKCEQLRPASGSIGPEANGTHQTLMNLALARAKV
jgi:polyphosphate kinase